MRHLLALLLLCSPLLAQTTYEDVPYGMHAKEHVDIHIPSGGAPTERACVVYVHGRGDAQTEEDIVLTGEPWAGLLAADVAIVSVDYPGSETHSFPDQWYSVLAALDAVRMLADGTYPGLPFSDQWDPDRIGVAGSSIGASLTGVLVYGGFYSSAFAIETVPVMSWPLMYPGFAGVGEVLHPMIDGGYPCSMELASPLWWLKHAPALPVVPTYLHNVASAAGTPPVGPHDPLHGDLAEAAILSLGGTAVKQHGMPLLGSDLAAFIETVAP